MRLGIWRALFATLSVALLALAGFFLVQDNYFGAVSTAAGAVSGAGYALRPRRLQPFLDLVKTSERGREDHGRAYRDILIWITISTVLFAAFTLAIHR